MKIRIGIYSLNPKVVAYRNDFCLSCEAPRRAHQIRGFGVLHLFFVPVLPLGFWRRWRCSECGNDPHVHPRIPEGFQWSAAIFAILTAAVWLVPVSEAGDSIVSFWVIRFLFPIGLVFAVRYALKSKRDPRLPEKLREVMPAQESLCPFCNAPFALSPGDRWRCSGCAVERKALRV